MSNPSNDPEEAAETRTTTPQQGTDIPNSSTTNNAAGGVMVCIPCNNTVASNAYQQTRELLSRPATFLAPISSVVGLRNVVQEPMEDDATSLLTPNRGHHALFRALEELDGLEKQEAELQLHNPLTPLLTTAVTGDVYHSPAEAIATLEALCQSVPRRVCQHPFKRNDIVWVCRTCQADETCVLCHSCFKQSNHEGHDVAFYHAQAGGCCDCGDPDAWDPQGFCPHHGPSSSSSSSLGPLSPTVVDRVKGAVPATVDWMVQTIAAQAEEGHLRARPEENNNTQTLDSYFSSNNNNTTSSPNNVNANNNYQNQNHNDNNLPSNNSQHSASNDTMEVEVESFDDTAAAQASLASSGSVFNPTAAGSSKSNRSGNRLVPVYESRELKLGRLGREGGGLYLVLRTDDIHNTAQWVDALRALLGTSSLYTESILQKLVRALRQFGQLVIWGTMELVAECSATQVSLWLDGDAVATAAIGRVMLQRASLLTSHGLFCSIVTLQELYLEQRAVAVLQWLTCVARSCDPLCQTVAESIRPDRHLVPLLRADFKLSSRITKYWHSLLLTLLAVPTFKSHLAAAYCDTYQLVTAEYARGMGVLERSGYALSVQFLNRVTYVVDLVQGRDLLGKLGRSLLETLKVAVAAASGPTTTARLNPNHFCLTHRRYSPCISDLKCVLNVKGMPRLFASASGTFLQDWILALGLGQWMDPQTWRDYARGHVENEHRGWVGAFNASISLGSLFERLLSWDDDDPSPIQDPTSPLSQNLLSCVELTTHVLLHGIHPWQEKERPLYLPTPLIGDTNSSSSSSPTSFVEPFAYGRRQAALPFSTVAVTHGSTLAFQALPISQITPFSFHLPLHRFVAACLREVCLRPTGMDDLFQSLKRIPIEKLDPLFGGLLEFPLLVLSRAAQVRAGLWRRNGPGLNDQVLNYAEPPFCRAMRDADLLLLQFSVLGQVRNQSTQERPDTDVGVTILVHLLLHRLGLFDFCGLAKAPNTNIEEYWNQVNRGYYPAEVGALQAVNSNNSNIDAAGGGGGGGGDSTNNNDNAMDSSGNNDEFSLPWTFSPAKDASSSLLLLEEFLHLMIIITSELPPFPPKDKKNHTAQAKWRLRREVIHRLVSGPKTHSELAEVHHVLSHWDNVFLSEEGKLVNPDDATGAALGAVLAEVADRKVSRGKLEPDKWELQQDAWESYDPSFFHISLRSHQTAAESRPSPPKSSSAPAFGVEAKSFSPVLPSAHTSFARLRRDITCDATVLAVVYRTLHIHCRDTTKPKPLSGMRGTIAYEGDERSETALARAVHLLTLGAYAWQSAKSSNPRWRQQGGGSVGSVFANHPDGHPAPVVKDWIQAALLSSPSALLADSWYEGEETTLQLLRRLAVVGGCTAGFVAQDRAVRSGAAWLCEFAIKYNPDAARLIGSPANKADASNTQQKKESEIDRRKRIAKEKAIERMKAQAAKFASMMEVELGGDDANNNNNNREENNNNDSASERDERSRSPMFAPSNRPTRQGSFGSARSSSSIASTDSEKGGIPSFLSNDGSNHGGSVGGDESLIPPRLLRVRPQCIICSDDGNIESRTKEHEEAEGHRKSRRRRADGGNALAFVGYAQASTVLKGGGGPPSSGDFYSPLSPVRRFVGMHAAFCGHAVHSECWESYLATVSHREDRVIGKRDEFRCPLCQRLSNCLIPFIDVGVDWIDSATCLSTSSSLPLESNTKSEDQQCDDPSGPSSLREFLTSSPWWVARHNKSVVWDGQCAFVTSVTTDESVPSNDRSSSASANSSSSSAKPPRRRSVRSLRKKDLYAAWNAMMRTPRVVRRRLRSRGDGSTDDIMSSGSAGASAFHHFPTQEESTSGETVVWRRFMDQISDISYRSDGKRLSDENFHYDFGEFRHYTVEKHAYNMANRFAGRELSDWPSCVFPTLLSDTQKQELSREKLLSKLMMSIQAFTYSCSCEAYEARRLIQKLTESSSEVADASTNSGLESIYSKFGISGLACDGKIIIMPRPSSAEDDGSQPFNGRLGRLRYFGLAVMAATGAVAADLVQLVLGFPLDKPSGDETAARLEKPFRAPIVYPILLGHVLTHVVAAVCASSGRARARSDSLELVWPVPFSSRGSFVVSESASRRCVDSVVEDFEGFIKLGMLARILQVVLGKIDIPGLDNIPGLDIRQLVVKALRKLRAGHLGDTALERNWFLSCISLVEMALIKPTSPDSKPSPDHEHVEMAITDRFREGTALAAEAACSFLVDIGTILQVLLPGVMARYASSDFQLEDIKAGPSKTLKNLEKIRSYYRFEPVLEMLESPLVQQVVANWYETACGHTKAATLPGDAISGSGAAVCSRLFRTQGFRVFDWPMESCQEYISGVSHKRREARLKNYSSLDPQDDDVGAPMEIDSIQTTNIRTPTVGRFRRQISPALVTFSAKKSVPLLGGYAAEVPAKGNGRPRVAMIPTSYTDLYAELGQLLPDSEQTAVCLICGEVLNAGGKGDCTKHSYRCGAGTGMFFLLQECAGLIMHNGKAAYIHSPYVDSHGETPQYRGRPLNLDLDRYDHLQEVWSGHLVRQQVLAERGSSRQIIVPDFY